jgi:hypothetical protein
MQRHNFGTNATKGFETLHTVRVFYHVFSGNMVMLSFDIQGLSNGEDFAFTLPFPHAPATFQGEAAGPVKAEASCKVTDNGRILSTPGLATIEAGSNVVTIHKTLTGGGFSPTGTKGASGQILFCR